MPRFYWGQPERGFGLTTERVSLLANGKVAETQRYVTDGARLYGVSFGLTFIGVVRAGEWSLERAPHQATGGTGHE